MVDTYGAHECRVYYVEEANYGVTPATPAMLGINSQSVEPGLNPGLIPVRGVGSRDLQSLTEGLRKVSLKIPGSLSAESPISFIQHAQTLNSLSIEVLYFKGLFASPTDVISFLYKGCRIDKLSVECHIEDVIKAAVELIGQNVALGTAKIGTTYGDYAGAVPFHESYVKKGDPDGSNLAAVERCTDFKFNIDNHLKPTGVIKSLIGVSSGFSSDAEEGTKWVHPSDITGFNVGDRVRIEDDNNSEINWITAVDPSPPPLITVKNDLQHTYAVADNGKITVVKEPIIKLLPPRHRDLNGELTFEFESIAEFDDVMADKEFSLAIGLGTGHQALFKYCKWQDVGTPTRIEDLVALKALFIARDVAIS